MNRIDPVRLGLAGGILWAVCMFVLTLIATATEYSRPLLEMMGSVYPGYSISIMGSAIGLIYGFVDAFLFLFLLGFIYNLLGPKAE